jgi:hypothetical protein
MPKVSLEINIVDDLFESGSVYACDFDTLANLIAIAALGLDYEVDRRRREFLSLMRETNVVLYLYGYLREYSGRRDGAVTVVVECDYIDHEFLKEYAGFYSSGYAQLEKKTTRLHFFSGKISQPAFDKALVSGGQLRAKISERYLGFTVIRPKPQSFMGRTCLKIYPDMGSKSGSQSLRSYPVWSVYHVNLFGLELSIKSVAFHEKDNVVGVCATSALYSLLHGSRRVLGNVTYSGFEITQFARNAWTHLPEAMEGGQVSRLYPNTGLTVEQVYHILTQVDLSPIAFATRKQRGDHGQTLGQIYAYLCLGLPVLAYVAMGHANGGRIPGATHVVTITGFSSDLTQDKPFTLAVKEDNGLFGLQLLSSYISKFYIHDDNIGPFSRFSLNENFGASGSEGDISELEFVPKGLRRSLEKGASSKSGSVLEPYRNVQGLEANEVSYFPRIFVVPAGGELRLAYTQVQDVAAALNIALVSSKQRDSQKKRKKNFTKAAEALNAFVWDIRFSKVEDVRREWRGLSIDSVLKRDYLKVDLPKYMARVICVEAGSDAGAVKPLFEVLLDATSAVASEAILTYLGHCEEGDAMLIAIIDHLEKTLSELKEQNARAVAVALINLTPLSV